MRWGLVHAHNCGLWSEIWTWLDLAFARRDLALDSDLAKLVLSCIEKTRWTHNSSHNFLDGVILHYHCLFRPLQYLFLAYVFLVY